jgi:1-deoxy-D-xylulose-5-phosphate reductoisomerase
MKFVSILGSTGSIGTNALRVTAGFPDSFRVVGLAGGRNIALLAEQIACLQPAIASSQDADSSRGLQNILRHRGYALGRTRFVHGEEGNIEVACHPDATMVLSAITGAAGLVPTYRAVESGKHVALANKETLVMAGDLIMETARERGVEILPVDSEHNAIHQCLRNAARPEIRRLILTASGGPFRNTPKEKFARVTPEEALNHPTWRMGRKISIDSATLMNKGLEVIEASHLFGTAPDEVEVAVHPQSVVHSMVEFVDGSILAQLGLTDMRIPIQYALTYPERWHSQLPRLDIYHLAKLEFLPPDRDKFRCLDLAYRALRAGGTAPAVLNAANEVAVDYFLNQRIGFDDIPRMIGSVLDAHVAGEASSLDAILLADGWARKRAREFAAHSCPAAH